VSDSTADNRFQAYLLAAFGVIALLLTTSGIYGVLSYLVAQRTHEIGIRMALGARKEDVLRLMVLYGLRLAVLGVAIGVLGSLALAPFLAHSLFGIKPTDPATFAAVIALVLVTAFLAAYIPARRAAKV